MPQSGRTLRLLNGAGAARGPSGGASHLASQRRPQRRVPGPKWLTLCALRSVFDHPPTGLSDPDAPDGLPISGLVLCRCESGADETGQRAACKAVGELIRHVLEMRRPARAGQGSVVICAVLDRPARVVADAVQEGLRLRVPEPPIIAASPASAPRRTRAQRRRHNTIPRMKREGRLSSQAASAFAAWAYRSLCGVVQRPPEGSAPKPGPAGHGPW
jgi:hypothetical protein